MDVRGSLGGASQIRPAGNGVKQGRGRCEEMRMEGEDGPRRLTAGPPMGARFPPPSSLPLPAHLQTHMPPLHPPPSPRRSWDNALYTLITLSNWRALCSRAHWVLSKPINMKVLHCGIGTHGERVREQGMWGRARLFGGFGKWGEKKEYNS